MQERDAADVIKDEAFQRQPMRGLTAGDEPLLTADDEARVVLIGGEPLGPRHIWWNFVSSRKERIVPAADDWRAGRFPGVPGETESIPLPDKGPA